MNGSTLEVVEEVFLCVLQVCGREGARERVEVEGLHLGRAQGRGQGCHTRDTPLALHKRNERRTGSIRDANRVNEAVAASENSTEHSGAPCTLTKKDSAVPQAVLRANIHNPLCNGDSQHRCVLQHL